MMNDHWNPHDENDEDDLMIQDRSNENKDEITMTHDVSVVTTQVYTTSAFLHHVS